MKKTLATLLACFAFVGMAAAADLPSRTTAPLAPVPAAHSFNNWYVGGNFGGAVDTSSGFDGVWNGSKPSIGAVGGYQFNRFFGLEATYDYFFQRNGLPSGQTVFANGVVSYPITGTRFTPYALAGVGYGWDYFGDRGLYNVGVGIRTQINSSLDFDLRYRYINNWDNDQRNNVVTGGINYKF